MAASFVSVEAAVSALRGDDAATTTLRLADNSIGAAGAATLAEAVKVSATLTALELDRNSIDDATYAAVAVVLTRNEAFAARAPATRDAAALAFLLLHAATLAAPPPNVVVSALAALRPRPLP